MELDKFDPTMAELSALVAKTSAITSADELVVVKQHRIELRNVRIRIENAGKAYREEAVKYQKAVIEKEKELKKVIEPEIERLEAIEEEAKRQHELAIRRELLPARHQRLVDNGLMDITDEDLLLHGDTEFTELVNSWIADKNERDRIAQEVATRKEREALEAERKSIADERARIEHEKELLDAIAHARIEERDRAERLAQQEILYIEAERVAQEKKSIADQEALEAKKKYQNFLTKYKYVDDGSFFIENDGKTVVLYKKLGTLKI